MLHLAFSKQYTGTLAKKSATSLTFHTDKQCPPQAIFSRPILDYFNLSCVFFTLKFICSQISSVQLLSHVQLCDPMNHTASQASLSITNSRSSLKLMSIESVMPSSHLNLRRPLLLLPPIPPSVRVFSNESTLCMRWPKYWSFSFSISPSNEHPGLIFFRMDWLDLLAVQRTLKSLLHQFIWSGRPNLFFCRKISAKYQAA